MADLPYDRSDCCSIIDAWSFSYVAAGIQIPIMAVPEVREAYGRFPCDRHRDRSELELMFGEYVDFSMCPPQVRQLSFS